MESNDQPEKGRVFPEEYDDDDVDDGMEEEDIEIDKLVDHTAQGQLEEDEEFGGDNLQVDFLFLDPSQKQFFSVKALVNGLLDGFSFKSSDLANIICDQVVVGTMIGVEGDEERQDEKNVLAFSTILNLQAYENQEVMKEIVKYIMVKSEQHNENHETFLNILKSQTDKIGLLINERMINLSPQLVPTLHAQVCEDVNWIQQQNNEDSMHFKLKYVLCLSKCYKEAKQPIKKLQTGYDNFIYQKFEDFAFLQKAITKFHFTAHSSKNAAGLSAVETVPEEQVCERLIYMLTWEDYIESVQNLPSYLEQ